MIKKKIITICFVPCVLVILFSLWGCGKQDEQVSPEPSNVKSFKIDKVEKKSNEGASAENVNSQNDVKPADTGDSPPAVKADAPGPQIPKDVTEPVSPAPETVAEKDEPPVAEEQKEDVPADDASPESEKTSPEEGGDGLALSPAYASIDSGDAGKGLIYNPEGKIDPFEPLFRARQEKEVTVTGKAQTIRSTRIGKLTPLEKMDISQLKLTAIIMGQQKNIAMVQESTGKGHVVSKGTYIGINSGRVVEITKNTVIIEEEVEDLLGKIIVRKRELKLQKPLGEM